MPLNTEPHTTSIDRTSSEDPCLLTRRYLCKLHVLPSSRPAATFTSSWSQLMACLLRSLRTNFTNHFCLHTHTCCRCQNVNNNTYSNHCNVAHRICRESAEELDYGHWTGACRPLAITAGMRGVSIHCAYSGLRPKHRTPRNVPLAEDDVPPH